MEYSSLQTCVTNMETHMPYGIIHHPAQVTFPPFTPANQSWYSI